MGDDPAVANAAWWFALWDTVENCAFFVVAVAVAVQMSAHLFAMPHRKKVEAAQEIERLQLVAQNLRLEAIIQPRRLTADEMKSLVALLAKFPGRTVHVSSYMQDVEAAELARQFLRATTAAGLSKDDNLMRVGAFGDVVSGIAVSGSEKSLVAATTELLASFPRLALVGNQPVSGNWLNTENETAPFPLKIFVGVKPLPADAP